MNDHGLISQIKKGNTLAFKQLFDTYYSAMCFYLLNFTHDKMASEDIVQTVFVDFWNKREAIEIHTSVKSYLFTMAYNQFLMTLRTQNKHATLLEELKYEALQFVDTPTEEDLERKSQRLNHIIKHLPQRCQEVLKLKMEGLKYKDIAESLGLSIKTVESQMRIAFIKIKKDYKDDLILFLTLMD